MDAALALCGVDALCCDVGETLSGWVLYGSARQELVTLLGTLFAFCVGRRCTVTALPAMICLRSLRGQRLVARSGGGYACPGTFLFWASTGLSSSRVS